MRKTRLLRLQVGAILIAALVAAACNSGTGQIQSDRSKTSTTVSARSDPIAQLTASPPEGFISESRNAQSGTPTGAQTFSGADTIWCDQTVDSTGAKNWVASELRYFDKNPKYPSV